jgi:hypothetical protein
MKASSIIAKTFPFVLIRLLAYLIFFIGICLYTFIVVKIFGAIQPKGVFGGFLFILFLGGGWGIYRFVRNYINYMIKAAHIAVVSELAINGSIPEGLSMYQHGVGKVKKFFAASNLLFAVDRLVSASVRQIQRALSKIGNFLGFIPYIKVVVNVLNIFVDIILNYVDECIMAYIFLNEGQSAWKSAADGVVLYAQNWKTILKTGGKILAFLLVFFVAAFFIFNGIAMNIFEGMDAFAEALAIVMTIVFILVLKWAVIDSIIMIYMIINYIKVAYGAEPSYDLYGKLKGMSKKFGELVGKAQEPAGQEAGAQI